MKEIKNFASGLSVLVAIVTASVICGFATAYVIYEDELSDMRETSREQRDTIFQLRLQVVELESDLDITHNHWED